MRSWHLKESRKTIHVHQTLSHFQSWQKLCKQLFEVSQSVVVFNHIGWLVGLLIFCLCLFVKVDDLKPSWAQSMTWKKDQPSSQVGQHCRGASEATAGSESNTPGLRCNLFLLLAFESFRLWYGLNEKDYILILNWAYKALIGWLFLKQVVYKHNARSVWITVKEVDSN